MRISRIRSTGAMAGLMIAAVTLSGCGGSGKPGSSESPHGSGSTPSATTLRLGDVDGYSDFTIQVDSVQEKAPCLMTNLPARNGDFVAVHLTVTADRTSKQARSPLIVGNWTVRDGSGHTEPADYSRTMLCLPESKMLPTTLDRDGRASGELIFDIAEDATRLIDTITFVQPHRSLVVDLTGSGSTTVRS